MESGDIDNSQIQVSSESSSTPKVRLSDSLGWSAAASDSSPWIKVEFLALVEVTGVITKGGPGGGGWVTKYQLSYDDVEKSYTNVDYKDADTGNPKVGLFVNLSQQFSVVIVILWLINFISASKHCVRIHVHNQVTIMQNKDNS